MPNKLMGLQALRWIRAALVVLPIGFVAYLMDLVWKTGWAASLENLFPFQGLGTVHLLGYSLRPSAPNSSTWLTHTDCACCREYYRVNPQERKLRSKMLQLRCACAPDGSNRPLLKLR
jgi:hypothetical protein